MSSIAVFMWPILGAESIDMAEFGRRPGSRFIADCAEGARLATYTLPSGEEVIVECSPSTAPRMFHKDWRITEMVPAHPKIERR